MTQRQAPNGSPNEWRAPGVSAARPWWRKSRPGRLTTGLVGLSSAAILSVYAVGYLHTEPAEDQLTGLSSTPEPSAPVAATPQVQQPPGDSSARPLRNSAGGRVAPPPAPTSTPGNSTQTQPASGYRDGTYVGVGSSRHGSIQAKVVINGGRIVSAAITGCATRYPCSVVSALPGEVVARQGAPADYVSGATDSSRAYTQAIANALNQAGSS